MHVVRREPAQFGFLQSRWTLERLGQVCDWLRITTVGGLSQLLKRLDIRYKRGRAYIHSPDRHYDDKLSLIELARLRAKYDPERYVFLYVDELTYYRQPRLASAYEATGRRQPLAYQSYRTNTAFRIVAALNACTGKVTYRQRSKISVPQLSAFYADICAAYPQAEIIYATQDNWPVHFHPDVLARLQVQAWPYRFKVPPNWPTEPTAKAVHDDLAIQILCLPTYASWCNPTEKLWRWLRQDILHLHRQSDDWQGLKQRAAAFLDQFQCGSPELLRYVGLLPA
ncbi:MAG: transposase [Candidatus Bipolaricaulia bacterium]